MVAEIFRIFDFQYGGHLEFLKYANFNFPVVCGPSIHVLAKFRFDRINGCNDIANFQFPIWRSSAILNFGNMHNLTFLAINSNNWHVRAKFSRDRLNGCENIPNFRFPICGRPRSSNFSNMQNFV